MSSLVLTQVADVEECVGGARVIDAMDCSTQDSLQMSLSKWVRYYQDPKKEKLLNVISLEFSLTKLDRQVSAPAVVRQIDWIDNAWPKSLKARQTSSKNEIKYMKFVTSTRNLLSRTISKRLISVTE